MWPPISNPLANFIAPPKLVLGITQVGIIIDCKEPSDETKDYFKRKHNPKMP